MPEEEKKREVLKKITQSFPAATASQIGIQTNLEAKELGKILGELEKEEYIQIEKGEYPVYRPTEKGIKKIKEEEK
jgi:predicted transcriptional regulator